MADDRLRFQTLATRVSSPGIRRTSGIREQLDKKSEFDRPGRFQVSSLEALLALISVRFGPCLRLMELPMDLITPPVLHELANKCPKLQYLTLGNWVQYCVGLSVRQ